MQDREHNDGSFLNKIENAVWKSPRERSADAFRYAGISVGILEDRQEGSIHAIDQFLSQPFGTRFVLTPGGAQIRFGADPEPAGHSPPESLRLTSRQEETA